MARQAQGLSKSCLILFVAGGLGFSSNPAVAGDENMIRSIVTKSGAAIWIQPSEAMIQKGCTYQLEFDPSGTNSSDMLNEISGSWHSRGKSQTINPQNVGEKPRPHPQDGYYKILVQNCCGVGETSVEAGYMHLNFDKVRGVRYSYTLTVTSRGDGRFTARPSESMANLTTTLDFATKTQCP